MEQNTDNFLAAQIDKYFKRKYSSKLAWVIDKLGKFIGLPIVLIFSLGGVVETTLNVSRFDGCVFYLFAGLYYVLFMYWLAVKLEQAHTGLHNGQRFIRRLRSALPDTKKYIWISTLSDLTMKILGLSMAAGFLWAMHPQSMLSTIAIFSYLILYAGLFALMVSLFIIKNKMEQKIAEAVEQNPNTPAQ